MIANRLQPISPVLLFLGTLCSCIPGRAQTPEAVVAGFEQRVDAVFRADAGKPLKREKKRPPLAPGRGNYVRAYSFSMVEFAARCFYLGEMLDEANAALAENAQHYLDNPKDINDRDSFHWHADIVMRLIEMYGTKGTRHAGRLTRETEVLCLKPIWEYVRKCSWLGKAEYTKSKTWEIYSSENHHAMDFTACWHFAKIAKDRPEYKERRFDDDATVAEHYRAWNDYFVAYCRERARKGPCVEMMCPSYNSVWLKGFYNFYDFGEPSVRRSAGMLIDLYFAYWAQEQINGVAGGGKSRIRGVKGFAPVRHGIPSLAALYFGIGDLPETLLGNLNAALSDYRPPAVVAAIAMGARDGGPYEVRQRAQGLGEQRKTHHTASGVKQPSTLLTDGGGIVRYSYCDPAFTMGTVMTEARPLEDWVSISTQSRWQGVVFGGQPSARIVPIVVQEKKGRDVLNGQWAVQSKGSLITQKLKYNKGGGSMIVWMSQEGLAAPVQEDDVVFVEAERAYAAVRVVGSGFQIADDAVTTRSAEGSTREAPPGIMVIPEDDFAPVIVEVMAKNEVNDFDEFKRKVKAGLVNMRGAVVVCDTIYGDRLTLDTSYQEAPTINGKLVDYAPPKVLESPFLNSDYNSGIITISKGNRKKVLDFRARSGNHKAARNSTEQEALEQALIGNWEEVFSDSGTGDWRAKWFLDGEVGTVKTGAEGMTLFATGIKHHITVIKKNRELFIRVENPDEVFYGHMTNEKFPIISEGRIGLRHMFTRSARYQNFRVSTPDGG